jgi:hypothetical protein
MRNRTLSALACVAVSALLLAGCSSGGGTSTTGSTNLAQLVADSAQKSTATTSKLAIDVNVSQPGSQSLDLTGTGEFDYAKHTGVVTETIPSVGGNPGGTVEVREIGKTVYVKIPNATDPSKPWVKTDAATFGAQNNGAGTADPSQFLSYLRGASKGITDEGTDTVRGTQTRKLDTTLDLRKAAAKLPAQQKAALEKAIQQLGTSTIPAVVWIDDQGRLRKMTFSIDVNGGQGSTTGGSTSAAQSPNLSVTLELFDYGTPVHVAPPPSSQISSQSIG